MAKKPKQDRSECPGSVGGHDEGSNRDGKCTWCGRKFRESAPRSNRFAVSEATKWYEYFYSPDAGYDS